MIHGRNLIVALDGVAIAGAKSCQFQISQNFIHACAPTNGRTKRKIPTDYDWSMSVDCLIPNSTLSVSLVDKLIEGTRVLLTFTDGSGQKRAGFAYVKSCDEGGSVGSLATFSASFESDGELYKYIAINPTPFTEGQDKLILIDSQGYIMIEDDQIGENIAMGFVGIQNTKQKIYIIGDTNGFISNDTQSNIKANISDLDDIAINHHVVASWTASKEINLPVGNYWLVEDGNGEFYALVLTPVQM